MSTFGLYLHIPFCVKKCNYCDFLSFPAKEALAFFQLFGDCLFAIAVAWVESPVVTIGTTATGYFPVPVRTGKPSVYRYLLHSEGKLSTYPGAKVVVIVHR